MANTKNDAADLNLSATVQGISSFFQQEFKPAEDGSITPDAKIIDKLLEQKLGGDVTSADVKKVQTLISDITAGAADAVGKIGIDFLKKHNKVDAVVLDKLHIGRDVLKVGIQREAAVGIGEHASVKHGHITAKLTSKSAGTSGAAFGRIKQHYAAAGAERFGKK